MNPTRMAEKPMFPTHRSNPSDGEPDAVKVARPVRRGGWRKPAGAVRPSAAPSLPNAVGVTGQVDAVTETDATPDVYEGTVRLNVQAQGNMGLMVDFTAEIREKPEFRVLRMANNSEGGVDLWLTLREPVPLRSILGQLQCVGEVSPTSGRDLSPDSDDAPLTVTLVFKD